MSHWANGRFRRALVCIAAVLVVGAIAHLNGFAQPAPPAAAPAGGQVDPSQELYALGFQFQGAATCSSVKCHGAPADAPKGGADYANPSFTLWSADATPEAPADPHRNAFKSLRNPKGQAIGKAMGIANPAADARCISCHALNAPQKLQGEKFQVTEGVTCNACHGPSGPSAALPAGPTNKGWVEQHTAKGWVAGQRTAMAGKHNELLRKTGLYDTRLLVERSQQCVSCHLAIDTTMVTAGHPQPTFEMNWFSLTYPNRHWTDPADGYFGAKLWAAGQAASLQAAVRQLSDRAASPAATPASLNSAYTQVMSHYVVFSPASAGGLQGDFKPIAGQIGAIYAALAAGPAKRAELAATAKAAADAAGKLGAPAEKWAPTKDGVMKVLAALLAPANTAPGLGGMGIEQQRDAVFALYNAYAESADGKADPTSAETRDFVGQKLFPVDAKEQPIKASAIPPAQHKAAIAEVKAKLKV